MEYNNVKEFARMYRKEILPILKSKGFTVVVKTSKRSYYHDGQISILIKTVPSNFDVYDPENTYVRQLTDNANKLLDTIKERIRTLAVAADLDLQIDMNYDRYISRN
jgi:D-alanine-D-alanine ligase-like ATP-grasp enzyme